MGVTNKLILIERQSISRGLAIIQLILLGWRYLSSSREVRERIASVPNVYRGDSTDIPASRAAEHN